MSKEDKPGLLMKYFVLKPHGNDRYAAASRKAMVEYSKFIKEENPKLAKELRDWVSDESAIAFVRNTNPKALDE